MQSPNYEFIFRKSVFFSLRSEKKNNVRSLRLKIAISFLFYFQYTFYLQSAKYVKIVNKSGLGITCLDSIMLVKMGWEFNK